MNRSTSSAESPAVIVLLLPLTEELAGAEAAALAAAPLERLLQTSLGYFIIFELRILDEILEHKKAADGREARRSPGGTEMVFMEVPPIRVD